MVDLFLKGGPIMWPLLIVSVVATTVVIERVYFLFKERSWNNQEITEKIFNAVERGDLKTAEELGHSSPSPIDRVISYGLANKDTSLSNALLRASNTELLRFSRGLSILDTIITLAPLLGLLGTVTGMISAFGLLGASELEAPTAITGGIAEALIATAFGLAIAISALIPYNYLNSKLEEMRHRLEDRATQLELLLFAAEEKSYLREKAA